MKVGLFTIGQSPREDVVSEMTPFLLPHIEIIEEGLLNNLTSEEIQLLKPDFGETPLATRLRDGSQVQLGEKKISPLFYEAVDRLRTKANVRAVGILCTHEFLETRFSFPVIFPFDYLHFLISKIFPIQRLGIIIPLENQVEMAMAKWEKEKVIVEAKSPYIEGKPWVEIAEKFNQENVEAVIMDCIGYKMKDKEDLQRLFSAPILLPRIILAQAINQLY